MSAVHVTTPMLVAFDHFLGARFTENGSGAAVGNFCQESGELLIATMFREHPDYSGGVPDALKSGGIAEWLGARKTAYIAFSGRAETRLGLPKGSLLNDLGTQCDFVVYELQTTPKYATLYNQLTSGTRSVTNLTANFMEIYEVPALRTANLDNRIAHAQAVVARARELKAAEGPQIGPPAAIPPGLPPQAPAPAPKSPAPPSGPPPISSAIAGMDAAILDHFGAIVDDLTKQRDAIDVRIAKIKAQAADFATLEGAETLPPLLQAPAAAAVAKTATSEGIQKMLGTSWVTSLFGTGSIAGAVATVAIDVANKQMPDQASMALIFSSLMSGIGLLQAKDKNVTGGTVPQTMEAQARAASPPIRK